MVIPTYERCKEKWNYVFVKDSLFGEVIYFQQAPFLCGSTSSASITIIKTNNNDSLRILLVCPLNKPPELKQKLVFIPDYTYYKNVALPFNTGRSDCMVQKTCYATLVRK